MRPVSSIFWYTLNGFFPVTCSSTPQIVSASSTAPTELAAVTSELPDPRDPLVRVRFKAVNTGGSFGLLAGS